jgi:hypothetical protein
VYGYGAKMTERAELLIARLQELDESEQERLSGILLGVLDDELDDDFPVSPEMEKYVDEDGNIDFDLLRADSIEIDLEDLMKE